MKPFKFKLEALITLKEASKEKALEAYASAIKKREAQQSHYDNIKNEIHATSHGIETTRTQVFKPQSQSNFLAALNKLNQSLKNAFELLMKAHETESKMLTQFLLAKSELDILSKLKEKQKREHILREEHKEEKEIEDIVNAKAPQLL